MKAFEIFLNGKKSCLAGIASGKGVLTAHVTAIEGNDKKPDSINLYVSGLDTVSDTHPVWIEHELQVGDEVLVRVIDSEEVDSPQFERPGMSEEERLQARLKEYHQLKEDLAGHID